MNYCEDLARHCQHYHGNMWNILFWNGINFEHKCEEDFAGELMKWC